MREISLFLNIDKPGEANDITTDIFFENIRNGYWQDQVLAVRTGKFDKKKLPSVTLSGKFKHRSISGLTQHSGLICIDIDDVEDINDTKSFLCADPHTYACFVSASGRGLAVVFKINPQKHTESFEGIQEYFFENYGLIIDITCKDVSRARFVSFDPDIYINEKAIKFIKYPKPTPKAISKLPNVVFVPNDFNDIINQICRYGVDIAGNYHNWVRIGFAIADKLGESGRDAFIALSKYRQSSKRNFGDKLASKQYDYCLKAGRTGITIATFYYFAKQAGIQIVSEKTKLISQAAYRGRTGRIDRNDIIKQLKQFEQIPETESIDIVNQVYDNPNIEVECDSPIGELETWLKHNYSFSRNEITRRITCNGVVMEQRHFNSIFIAAKKVFVKDVSYDLIEKLINSDFTPDFNPLKEWFTKNNKEYKAGYIELMAKTIVTDQPFDYVYYFLRKWFVGIASSVFHEPCSLMFVLSGSKQNTGKTEWFRRLLPREIREYYAESKLDEPKDDALLMCEKLIIMDDEMGGKSKKDNKKLKEFTSKKWFSLREPYGKHNVDRRRIAVLAGTTNEDELLTDPTGNRRIIPVRVFDIDKELYNSINKTDVFIEAYQAYLSGERSDLTHEDIEYLANNSQTFVSHSVEYELINKYFEIPQIYDSFNIAFLTNTDMKVELEKQSMQKLSARQIGLELKRIGFQRTKRNGIYGYLVKRKKTE